MDILNLFLVYLTLILVSAVMIFIYLKNHSWKDLVLVGAQMCSCFIPERLLRAMQGSYNYLFHTRNHVFVVLHLVLQVLVYAEYSWEIFGCCYDQGFTLCSLVMPYLLLTVNLGFFALTCFGDPVESDSKKKERKREWTCHGLQPLRMNSRRTRLRRYGHLSLPENDLLFLPPKY